ncbi:unnamed protein product [Enterobius vermicularis]|uniref:Ovule protein n=1 Tax=Enterobius vermicularis TaxID=51028 RepID=A0A0N4VBS5_ENTVE|nr:unnamed protein product [Enterobius vermicularis]
MAGHSCDKKESIVTFVDKKRKLFDAAKKSPCRSPVKQVKQVVPVSVISPMKKSCFSDIELETLLHASLCKRPKFSANDSSQRSPLKPVQWSRSEDFERIGSLVYENEVDREDPHPEELNADDAALLNQCLDERTEPFENTQVSEEQQPSTNGLGKGNSNEDGKKPKRRKAPTKPKANYVRLNMKKRCYVRGHVSASSKRKRWRGLRFKKSNK